MWLCLLPPRAVVASRAVERCTAHLQTLSVFHRSHSTHRIWLSPLSILPIVRCLFSLPYIFFVVNQTPVLFRTSFPSPFLFFLTAITLHSSKPQSSKRFRPSQLIHSLFFSRHPLHASFHFASLSCRNTLFSCLALQFFSTLSMHSPLVLNAFHFCFLLPVSSHWSLFTFSPHLLELQSKPTCPLIQRVSIYLLQLQRHFRLSSFSSL